MAETAQSSAPRYWRIRMKHPDDDLTKEAWEEGIIGIWYGAWNADQFEATLESTRDQAATALTVFNKNAGLNWKVAPTYVDTARRFWNILRTDWVFTYFDDCIHLAKVRTRVERHAHRKFGRGQELFKYRHIDSKKAFALDKLPDCFRLLSSAGRGNIHEVGGTRNLIRFLAESESEAEVCERFRRLSWEEWLDALGPHGWESLCLGYLILEHDFVPTSLDIGHTLPLFDLIGKNRTGHRIYAQCKKNPSRMALDDEFAHIVKELVKSNSVFLFAYGGCTNLPRRMKLLTAADLQAWFSDTVHGKAYMSLLTD